jgi:hypothetical protein
VIAVAFEYGGDIHWLTRCVISTPSPMVMVDLRAGLESRASANSGIGDPGICVSFDSNSNDAG